MKSKKVILDTNLWISFLISRDFSFLDDFVESNKARWQQHAAEYRVLSYQDFNMARFPADYALFMMFKKLFPGLFFQFH